MDKKMVENIKEFYDIEIKKENRIITFIINKANDILGYANKDYIRMTVKRGADKKYSFRCIQIQIPAGKTFNYSINRYGMLSINILDCKIKVVDMDMIVLE